MTFLRRAMQTKLPAKLIQEAKLWRQKLHSFPETAFCEHQTAQFVAEKLNSFGLEVHTGIGKTGVVGFLGGAQKTIALRADMDALPLQEENNFAYKSQIDGKMHACGHDGHTAILLATAKLLAQKPKRPVNVLFIFQPAEEGHGGAQAMIKDGLFKKFPCEAVFALHNWPTLPVGKIAIQAGPMMASSDFFTIKIKGKGTHAAMPHLGQDVITATAQLILALQNIVSRKVHPAEAALISVTSIESSSKANNILPEEIFLKGTCRAFSKEVRDFLEQEMAKVIHAISLAYQVNADFLFERSYPPTVNHEKEAVYVKDIAQKLLGPDAVITEFTPSMGAEDFAYFLEKIPGAYFWLGNGPSAPLHSPRYDFNDEILPYGVALWESIVMNYPT